MKKQIFVSRCRAEGVALAFSCLLSTFLAVSLCRRARREQKSKARKSKVTLSRLSSGFITHHRCKSYLIWLQITTRKWAANDNLGAINDWLFIAIQFRLGRGQWECMWAGVITPKSRLSQFARKFGRRVRWLNQLLRPRMLRSQASSRCLFYGIMQSRSMRASKLIKKNSP